MQSSLIVIPIEVNGSGPYDFVVDTGSQVTTIDPSLASELHVKAHGTTGVGGIGVYSRSAFVYLDSVSAGRNVVQNSLAVVQGLTQIKAADPHIRGILGSNFLEHFDLLIDNARHILCLDGSGALAPAVKSEHVALAEPLGSQKDLPFTRPMLISARLSASDKTPVLLRLDSASNAPLLYATGTYLSHGPVSPGARLTRVVNGIEQSFAILPPQDVRIGKRYVRQVSFVLPMEPTPSGPAPREDGLLPTIAFQRVLISCSGGYAVLEPWDR